MGKSFKNFLDQLNLGKFPQFVIFAVLEWTMILLLFADGLIAFVSNEFAKFFGLETPCLLCTRIDHILVKRNSSFYYNDSICGAHKKDVSSLAYCRIHDKLSDIRNMCQGCLLSFATEKDADCDKYKSLVGILHKDFDCFVDDEDRKKSSAVKKVDGGGGGGGGEDEDDPRCSCCGEIVKLKLSSKYIRSLSMKAPVSSPRASWLANGRNNVESPRTRYAELKFMSETGRDVSEVDASNNAYNHGKEAIKSLNAPSLPYSKDINEDACRTPIFARRNKYFPMPLNSAPVSPRVWLNNGLRKLSVERGGGDMIGDPTTTSNNDDDDVVNSNPLNEVDFEILNRLKKQVRLDNKSLMALYMELDEERSASNVAANNAMAMITRLQAEKAAVQMEALQYQRMMEEQAEYDEEAIQVMRDELSRRDDDVAALEYELEVYREKYGVVVNKIGGEICEVADEDNYYYQDGNNHHEETSLLDFEGEKSHLLGVLNDLEKKLNVDEGSIIMHEDEGKQDNKATITREVSLIKERLRALEEDSGFLQHAAMTMQRGENGTKLLTEIAQHLRKVRHSVKSSSDEIDERAFVYAYI